MTHWLCPHLACAKDDGSESAIHLGIWASVWLTLCTFLSNVLTSNVNAASQMRHYTARWFLGGWQIFFKMCCTQITYTIVEKMWDNAAIRPFFDPMWSPSLSKTFQMILLEMINTTSNSPRYNGPKQSYKQEQLNSLSANNLQKQPSWYSPIKWQAFTDNIGL